jgi:hypothetical protein
MKAKAKGEPQAEAKGEPQAEADGEPEAKGETEVEVEAPLDKCRARQNSNLKMIGNYTATKVLRL